MYAKHKYYNDLKQKGTVSGKGDNDRPQLLHLYYSKVMLDECLKTAAMQSSEITKHMADTHTKSGITYKISQSTHEKILSLVFGTSIRYRNMLEPSTGGLK